MAYVSNKTESKPDKPKAQAKSSESNAKLPILIAVCSVALLLLGFVAYSTFFKTEGPKSGFEKVAPPPGYPDEKPYNLKQWQDGKLIGGDIPKPPSMGGTPPIANPSPPANTEGK